MKAAIMATFKVISDRHMAATATSVRRMVEEGLLGGAFVRIIALGLEAARSETTGNPSQGPTSAAFNFGKMGQLDRRRPTGRHDRQMRAVGHIRVVGVG